MNTVMLPAESNLIDYVALHYLPCDASQSFAPIKIIGDGNCFPRTLSYLLFKYQDHYYEMCTRIVYEAHVNKNRYLDNNYIKIGANHQYRRSTMVEQFAQYANNYIAGQNFNVEVNLQIRGTRHCKGQYIQGHMASLSGCQCDWPSH